MNIFYIHKIILILLLACLSFSNKANARIDILPQKILIESRERNSELTVLNLSDTAGTFRVEIVHFKQNNQGIYEEIQSPLSNDFDPADIVRISPRQFNIEPGGRQKIRVSLRKPPDLPEGEYRFHIKAIRLLEADELYSKNSDNVSIVANVGVTIPTIVRHGNVSAKAKLKNIQLVHPSETKNKKPALDLEIDRIGEASTLGILEVFWKQGGKYNQIGRIKNMNVFTDIDTRFVRVPLSYNPEGPGKIHIRYIDDTKKGHVFDEKWLQTK